MNTILVPIDFSDATPAVVETACQLARAFSARLVLVNVICPSVYATACGPLLQGMEIEDAKGLSDQIITWHDRLQNDGFEVETVQPFGNPADCIREVADKTNADCIVIGSHGHGAMYNLLIGSTASALLKSISCPVLVVPSQSRRVLRDAPVPTEKEKA